MEFTQAIVASGGLWVSGAAGFRLPMAFVFHLLVVKPYADSGAAADRPSWAQTIAVTVLLMVLAALDEHERLLAERGRALAIGPDELVTAVPHAAVINAASPIRIRSGHDSTEPTVVPGMRGLSWKPRRPKSHFTNQ